MKENPIPAADESQDCDDEQVIRCSRGEMTFDNRPKQDEFADFDAFADFILDEDAPRAEEKGRDYICAPMAEGEHNDPRKFPGIATWRLQKLAQGRKFLPFDIDGFDSPDDFQKLLDFLPGYKGFAYTTASHTAAAPRLRIVLAQSRETTYAEGIALGAAVQAKIDKAIGEGKLKFDTSVYRGEQPLYLPTADADNFRFDGAPVNVDAMLANIPPPEDKRKSPLDALKTDDRMLRMLHALGMVRTDAGGGKFSIECPFAGEHTMDGGAEETAYWLPHTGGFAQGHFHCFHSHCAKRTDMDFQIAIQARYAKERPVVDGQQQAANDEAKGETTSIWLGPDKARVSDLFDVELEPREFIVEGVIPVCSGSMIAPGNTGKSSLSIWEGCNIILEIPVWNRKVLRPGAALFLTAEDQARDLKYRLQQIANAKNLSPAGKKRLTDSFFIEDVSGQMARFVEKDAHGNLFVTDHIRTLVQKYEKEGLSIINIDPYNLFGPGESLLNDGEAAMAAAANAICNDLNCHVRYIKHTGQQVAREGIRDQYTGRGGSAGADNMRQVMQVSNGTFKDAPLPKQAELHAQLMGSAVQILTVDFHKVSYGPPQNHRPALIVRCGWKFEQYEKAEISKEDALTEDVQAVCRYVRSEIAHGRYPNKTGIEDTRPEGMTKERARKAVLAAVQMGKLENADLPKEKRVGAAKEYLKPRDAGDA